MSGVRAGRCTWRRGRALAALCGALMGLAAPLAAQRGERGRFDEPPPNVPYDGRWTFVRIRYDMGLGGGFGFRGLPPWAHDYPRGERNFSRILDELTTVRVRTQESVVLHLNDPDLFKYPVAYMAEPGFWRPNDAEVAGLRAYLLKGGFFIFDDFQGNHWYNLEEQFRRVMPEARWIRMTADHPIFDSFYRIHSLDDQYPIYGRPPEFWGIFEGNDPKKRLMVIANYNNDLSEYWEFSDVGYFPIDLSNEAFKIGINYIVYALTR